MMFVKSVNMKVKGILGLHRFGTELTCVYKRVGKVNSFNMVQQVVLQCHVLSTNGTLKATCAAFWSCYVSLQDVSIFQT